MLALGQCVGDNGGEMEREGTLRVVRLGPAAGEEGCSAVFEAPLALVQVVRGEGGGAGNAKF